MPPADSRPSVRTNAFRSKVEHASNGVLQKLAKLPPAALLVAALAIALVGALVRGVVGAICFGLLTLFLAWLLYLTWPRLAPLDRLMRLAVLLLTAVVMVVLAVPR
ncbi:MULTISPECIES: DUF6703 family protein [Barrientosiimonas]|uniref:DUF6703 family protein n=1 Tax=Barrientosiimonas TaxID=1535207 RepID=UPI00259B3C70|nr:DUF6703 family protein [Barrientosiimonas endolithica]